MTFQKYSTLLFSVIFVFIARVAFSQPANPMADPDVVPITGVEWLLIAGGAMGGYKLLKKKREDADESEH